MGPSGRITHVIRYIAYIGLFRTGKCRFIQVFYLGRAPRTKETLPDFQKWCRVTRHPLIFHGLTVSQRTPGFGASHVRPKNSNFWKTGKIVISITKLLISVKNP